jgi:hypothetical protein
MSDETGVPAQRRRTPEEIEQIVAGFADSGLNRTEFCRRHRLSLGTLKLYLKRQAQGKTGAVDDGLVAVELGTESATNRHSGGGLALVLLRGRRIEVETGFDAPTLERLIILLEQM